MAPASLELLVCIDPIGGGSCILNQPQSLIDQEQANPGNCNIAYLCVSNALQDADNQKLGIVEYTYAEGLQPVEIIEEMTSGKTPITPSCSDAHLMNLLMSAKCRIHDETI